MFKIRVLLRIYLQMLFQDFLYLTMLFSIIVFGLTADHLLEIGSIKKFSLLLIGIFFLSLFSTMNLYHNDKIYNRYLKQKINSYWSEVVAQILAALIVNLVSGILIFLFSNIADEDIAKDVIGVVCLVTIGLLGSAIATLFKTQWYRHFSLGQIGTLVLVYLALSGSVIQVLSYAEIVLPPLSKMIVTLQREASITTLLPVAGQAFAYAIVLFLISSFIYKKKRKN